MKPTKILERNQQPAPEVSIPEKNSQCSLSNPSLTTQLRQVAEETLPRMDASAWSDQKDADCGSSSESSVLIR